MAEQHEADGTGSSAGAVGPTDDLVTTDHVLATPGGELRYAATAGRVVLREEVDE
jgi:hypothetical protein